MTDELDLLASVAGKGGERKGRTSTRATFEASIIATYNAYLPFYEDVVLRRLAASGCQHNVLLLDSGQLAQSLSAPTARPRHAGKAYTLVPMHAPGAFHPKIALLVGKKNTRIFVGSHNVTLSGFGLNREITTQIDVPRGSEDPDAALAQRVWGYLESWLLHQGDRLPQSVLDAARRIATNFAPWLKESQDESGDIRFFGGEPQGKSLWELVRPTLPDKTRRVIISGPFYDRNGEFLRILSRDLQTPELIVGVEPEKVELCRQEALPAQARVVDASKMGRGSGYLHAKTIWIEGESGETMLITGSANPSSAAWTEGPTKRNAEAVLVHHGDAARVLAERLGITAIPSMPELHDEKLQQIEERVAKTKVTHTSASALILVAEASEKEITLSWPELLTEQIKAVRYCCGDHDDWKHPEETYCDTRCLHIILPPEEIVRIGFVEVELVDGKLLHALVHHPAFIAKLSRTSTQRRFREALDSLESESPDLPTVIRLAENLIFDSEELEPARKVKGHSSNGEDEEEHDSRLPETLAVSAVETKHHKRGIRELQGNDLAYVIDILIYRLGLGLRNAAEQLEDTGPGEEEQRDSDEDRVINAERPQADLVKLCQGKVRTLTGRMLKQFELWKKDKQQAHRPVSQLLAVLAVMREVRAKDNRLSDVIGGNSLVPQEQRKRLLDGSLSALFGRNLKLFDAATQAFKDDPENDLSRLLGLLLWLAWDSGIDARSIDRLATWDIDQRREGLLNLARLLEVCVAAGKAEEVFSETEHSVWRTAQESARGGASSWVKYHRDWSRALADLRDAHEVWKRDGSFGPGTLGIAIYEQQKKVRIVLGLNRDNVILAELGEKQGDKRLPKEKQEQVQFKIGSVEMTEFPRISQ